MRTQALLKQLIKRETDFRREFLTGTVLTPLRALQFDQTGGGSPVWVASIEIGSNRPLIDVVVLASNDGTRRYAKVGKTVMLRMNTMGRYDAIGPADRVASTASVKTYNVGIATAVTAADFGYTFERVPFEWYANSGNPGESRWNDTFSTFPLTRVVDADGNPV
jgi:hypothetical protein